MNPARQVLDIKAQARVTVHEVHPVFGEIIMPVRREIGSVCGYVRRMVFLEYLRY